MLREELKNIKSEKKDLRNFGLSVGGVLCVLAGVLYWYGRPAYPYIGAVGVILVLLGLIFPRVLQPLQKVWMSFAVVMGFFMTKLILSILYFIAFTGIGLLMRILGKRPLDLKLDKGAASYWDIREKTGEEKKSDYERQF